jgi:hypothetical protein
VRLQAAARLRETLAWRREAKPETMVCEHCLRDPRSHYFHPVGFHKDGMPVMYSCNALASDRSLEGNRAHMILTFEQAIRLMPPGVEKWVWCASTKPCSACLPLVDWQIGLLCLLAAE